MNTDSSLDEDIKDANIVMIEKQLLFIISPDSGIRTIVDLVSFILILFISLYIPFIFAFNVDTSGYGY